MAGFCRNSNTWLDFLWVNPESCPYAKNGEDCNTERCGYYEERKPTTWYKRKAKILKSFSDSLGLNTIYEGNVLWTLHKENGK